MRRMVAVLVGGLIFGYGLALSGMAQPEIVLGFLQLSDMGLLLVLGAAVVVSLVGFQVLPRIMHAPIFGGRFDVKKEKTSKQTIFGAVIFGVGWGISGMCPGSAWASLGIGNWPILMGLAGMFIGAYVYGMLTSPD